MKKSFVFFCTLMVGALSFSSCNKSLKDDVKDLRNQLGFDEPISVTTTFTDYKNESRTVTGVYKFKDGASGSNALIKNANGTYTIRIERGDAIHSDEGVELYFTYDPTTKKILEKGSTHYWEDQGTSNSYVNVQQYEAAITGLTFNLDIKSIDLETGSISVEVKIEGTKEYSQAHSGYVPNSNSGFTTTYTFTGKLKKFTVNQPA
ncbi:MAG: hypothetical protein J7578_22295 [Chitinophagaceae bacterium]|nr:hypothetical protein [Chitinophagaceae bacterium]